MTNGCVSAQTEFWPAPGCQKNGLHRHSLPKRGHPPSPEEEHSVVDSTVVSAAVTLVACTIGGVARVLVARITTRALLRRARIEEEGRTARINALREGGTLQERDETGRHLAVRQGERGRGDRHGPYGG